MSLDLLTHCGDDVGAALPLDCGAQLRGGGHADGNGGLGQDELGDLRINKVTKYNMS